MNREINYRLVPLNALCINSIINIRCTRCCIFKPSWFMLLLSYSYFIAVPHWIASLMRHIGTINQYFRNSSHVLLLMLHVCNQGLTKKFLNNCQAKNLIWLTIMYLVFYTQASLIPNNIFLSQNGQSSYAEYFMKTTIGYKFF